MIRRIPPTEKLDDMSHVALRVGIAVVMHRGQYLVGIRPPGKPLAGFSEFPGGKCEPGEPSEACAIRECQEETGLRVTATEHLLQHRFKHANGELDLGFWRCQLVTPTAADPLNGFRWVEPAELWTLRFPEANAPLLELLRQQHP